MEMQGRWDNIVGWIMSNWWLLPVVAIVSIWLGAGLGIVVAALMAAAANGDRQL
jgi:hypothetical protein